MSKAFQMLLDTQNTHSGNRQLPSLPARKTQPAQPGPPSYMPGTMPEAEGAMMDDASQNCLFPLRSGPNGTEF